jgi:hypothetical protein
VEEYVFGKSHSLKILLSLSLLMTFDFADRMIIAGLLPIIKEEWRITDTEAGLLSSVLYLGMVIFVFPASLLIDRWSRLKMASLTGVFWSLSSAAGAWTKSFSELVVTRAFVGIGEAGYAPAAYVWISAAFPGRRRQLALGIFSTGQPIGMAVGVALGGYVGKMLGWHQALGLMAAPGLLIAILIYRGRDYQNLPVVADSADPLRQSVLHQIAVADIRISSRCNGDAAMYAGLLLSSHVLAPGTWRSSGDGHLYDKRHHDDGDCFGPTGGMDHGSLERHHAARQTGLRVDRFGDRDRTLRIGLWRCQRLYHSIRSDRDRHVHYCNGVYRNPQYVAGVGAHRRASFVGELLCAGSASSGFSARPVFHGSALRPLWLNNSLFNHVPGERGLGLDHTVAGLVVLPQRVKG